MKDEIDLARVWSRSDHPPGVSNHDWISSCRFSDSANVNNSDRVHLRYSRTWLFTDGWTGPTGLFHSSYLQGHGKWQTGNAKAIAGTVSLRIHLPSSGIQPSATINTGLQQQHRGPASIEDTTSDPIADHANAQTNTAAPVQLGALGRNPSEKSMKKASCPHSFYQPSSTSPPSITSSIQPLPG